MRRGKIWLIAAVLLFAATWTGCAGAREGSQEASGTQQTEEVSLKPGEEGFDFDYQLPEDWEPVPYPEDNGKKMLELHMSMDTDDKEIPLYDYYLGAEPSFAFAEQPTEEFWSSINEELPKELYELAVNLAIPKNDFRLVSSKEFAQLNGSKIPYYVDAARRGLLAIDNVEVGKEDEYLKQMLYYSMPGGEKENTIGYHFWNFAVQSEDNYAGEEGAFVTDDSLCYLAADGTIRVRGLVLFINKFTDKMLYGKVYTEVSLGVVPETAKEKENEWEFGDFYLAGTLDLLQMEYITEEEYQELLEKYQVETGLPALQDWAGTYGGQ